MGDSRFVEVAEPKEVFSLLSDGTRVAILRALWKMDARTVTFSDLREAVGNPDSGQFSYHLRELVESFVRKTERGYRLTQAGRQINGVIESGAYTMEGAIEPISLDGPCRACGGTQTFHYEGEIVCVECNDCPATSEFAVPPGVFAGVDRETIPRVANRYLRATIRHITGCFCWYCEGRVRPTVAPIPEIIDPRDIRSDKFQAAIDDDVENIPWVRFDCQRCDTTSEVGLHQVLLDHPAVAGFYYDHGVDVRERAVWTFPSVTDDRTAITSHEPFRARVSYRVDDEEITLVVDEELAIVDVDT